MDVLVEGDETIGPAQVTEHPVAERAQQPLGGRVALQPGPQRSGERFDRGGPERDVDVGCCGAGIGAVAVARTPCTVPWYSDWRGPVGASWILTLLAADAIFGAPVAPGIATLRSLRRSSAVMGPVCGGGVLTRLVATCSARSRERAKAAARRFSSTLQCSSASRFVNELRSVAPRSGSSSAREYQPTTT